MAERTIIVLARVIADPLMESFSESERDIVKWASLLHNFGRLGKPAVKGDDHAHPFKAASIALDILESKNLIPDLMDHKKRVSLAKIKQLISESIVKEEGIKVHSHHNLHAIFLKTWTMAALQRGSFADLVFRIIMF